MKRYLLIMIALAGGLSLLQARPVDVERAKVAGQQFVRAHFNSETKSDALELVYTGLSSRSEACFYAFNVGQEGFVIVSADDRFRPIVGYSDEGTFATENPSPELMFYLDRIIEARTSRNAVIVDNTAEEWQSVMSTGRLLSRNGGRGIDYLCTTKWNQDSPYNLYAPDATSGPGGRCYAGCVATAMSQVMKFWDHPQQGTGSHSYYCYGYGNQSANFGQTTYRWDLMPDRLGGASQEEIEAVALLMYHCGVSVDMNFSPTGSGANSWDVPYAIRHYFSYTNQCSLKSRDEYSLTNWQNMLKEQFELGWPVYYSGFSNDGGHAFVCDGYTDDDLFHFNWGWGGSSDGWFVIDEIDYAGWAQAVFNYVPSDVYDYMPQEPTNFEVVSHGSFDYSATLTWTNPTHNIHNDALTSIDQIVVTRDGEIIYTEDNVAPGATMSFTDSFIPTVVRYGVYAVVHNAKGKPIVEEGVILGPSCVWRLDMTSDNSDGWNNGYISFVNDAGVEVTRITAYSTSYSSNVELPLGRVGMYWNKPSTAVEKIGFELKDGAGNVVVSFDGSSNDLNKGLFYIINNSCGDGINHNAPKNLIATRNGAEVRIAWEAAEGQVQHYYVYRDNVLVAVAEGTEYVDAESVGFHTYYVTAINENGESDPSNIDNVYDDGLCESPVNLRYEMTTPSRVKVSWDAPQDESLTGYILYRRSKGEEFKRIKLLNKTFHTDNLTSVEDERYEYAVTAFYQATDCESGYATSEANPAMRFIEVNKSIVPHHLDFLIHEGHVVLQWEDATMAEWFKIYRNGEHIGNSTGTDFVDYEANAEHNYRYTVTGCNGFVESSHSNEVFVDWTTGLNEVANEKETLLYPNPTSGMVFVESYGLQNVEVFNLVGQMVIQQTATDGQATVDMTSLPEGTYFVKLIGERNEVKKVVKIQ